MRKNNNILRGVIPFPCHSKEKVLVYEGARGCCSIKCPYCEKIALFNFDTMESTPSRAARGALHRLKKQNKYID